MANQRNGPIRVLRVKKGESRKSIYAKARRAFTAADLQRYTESEEMLPAEDLVKELDAIHRGGVRKQRRKKT
jgi:hypothetical protein